MSTSDNIRTIVVRPITLAWLPKIGAYFSPSLKVTSALVILPTAGFAVICYGSFIVWTFVISLTDSNLLPSYRFVGWHQYARLLASARWWTACDNLAIYCACLVCGCIALGYSLAILVDRTAQWQGFYRTLLMLPLSISYVATGVIWQWLMNPALGIQHAVHELGWTTFAFDWLVRPDKALYTIVLVGIWQQAGVCLVIFLAALRSVDPNIWKVTRVDGIPSWRIYLFVITPAVRGAFVASAVLLLAVAAKSYDLVVTLTGGGPGFSSDLPAYDVVQLMNRQELGMGAAGACMLLCAVAAVVAPFLYLEKRRQGRGER